MIDWLIAYQGLADLTLLNVLLALSQYVILRAGAFSVATAGLAAIGAYTAADLIMSEHMNPALAVLIAAGAGAIMALLLSIPLARLRGVFQAIATLAFVQIVLSLSLYADTLTGGANGVNGIPKAVQTWHLVVIVAIVLWMLGNLGRSSTGRAFEAIQHDEHVAVAFGVEVTRTHALAFTLSGFLAGLTGGLIAAHNYSVVGEQFGFDLVVQILSFVVLGGRRSLAGPVVGAIVLTWLPELARPLADNRMVIYGALLMVVIIYLPHGLVDTVQLRLRARRRTTRWRLAGEVARGGA